MAWLTSTKYLTVQERICVETNKAKRDADKATIPAITPSAECEYHSADKVIRHSGLLQFDIDQKDNPHIRNYTSLKAQIAKFPFVAYCGLSVSKTGDWGLVPIAYPERHGQHFDALKRIFVRYRINLDDKPRNVVSLRGYSYDPDAYFAKKPAQLFELYDEPKAVPVREFSRTMDADAERTRVEACMSEINRRAIDITSGYNYWYAIGCDLASTFGESGREYFHIISQIHPDYNTATCDKQYTHCLRIYKEVQLKTFFGRCRDNGVSWKELMPWEPSERTRPLEIISKTRISPTYKSFDPLPATKPVTSTRIQPDVTPVEMVTVIVDTLDDWAATPGSILRPDEAQLERLAVEPVDNYPSEWDEPSPPGAVPTLIAQDYFDWQRKYPPFNQLGLASLPTQPL